METSMTAHAEILKNITDILRDILHQPALVLTEASSADQVERWDSLAHVNLIMSIERHYQIKFSLGEIKQLRNVGEMMRLITSKTASTKTESK
jgi:acyl carrier protein